MASENAESAAVQVAGSQMPRVGPAVVDDMTVPTGMFQATRGHERPQMQSQTACQSTEQAARLQIDLDTLGQDDFDLAGSALPGQRPAGVPGTATKKARRGSKHRNRDRITPHQKTWRPDS